jgi:hypothetical protein
VQPKSKPHAVEHGPNCFLWLRIAGSDRTHDLRAATLLNVIHATNYSAVKVFFSDLEFERRFSLVKAEESPGQLTDLPEMSGIKTPTLLEDQLHRTGRLPRYALQLTSFRPLATSGSLSELPKTSCFSSSLSSTNIHRH